MKAILIDPERRTVEDLDFTGDYKKIQETIGVDLFTCLELDDARNTLYVDDEGLLKDPEHFFVLKVYPQPLAGKGLILGSNEEGDSTDTSLTADAVRGMIEWQSLRVEGFDHFEGKTPDGSFVIGSTPRFSKR